MNRFDRYCRQQEQSLAPDSICAARDEVVIRLAVRSLYIHASRVSVRRGCYVRPVHAWIAY